METIVIDLGLVGLVFITITITQQSSGPASLAPATLASFPSGISIGREEHAATAPAWRGPSIHAIWLILEAVSRGSRINICVLHHHSFPRRARNLHI